MEPLIDVFALLVDKAPDVSRSVSEGIKVWLCLLGVVLALVWNLLPRPWPRRLLVGLVLVAGFNYARWGPKVLTEKVDNYDLYHYYLNAKYFPELGYYDLYPAGMYADIVSGGPSFNYGPQYMAQDEEGHGMQPIMHGLQRGKLVAETRFTPESWEAFKHDALFLQRQKGGFTDKLWRQMIQDHGFNGTPAWVAEAAPLAKLVPVEHIKWLGYVDVLALAAAVGAIVWAYGPTSALWMTFFLLVTYSTRWPTFTWAYLRYDWVATLLVAMAFLRKGHHLVAGLFAGHSAAMRFFPAMWLFGPATKGVYDLLGGTLNRKLVLLAAGFFLSFGGLVGLGAVAIGPQNVKTHFENMMDHNSPDQLSSRRIGLAVALPFSGDLEPKFISKATKRKIADQKPLRFSIALMVMAGYAWSLRRMQDDESFAFGFVPFFLLTTASYYYLVCRVTLMVIHGANLHKRRHQVGLVMLVGLEAFSNWAEFVHSGHRVFLIGWLAWGLCAYTMVQLVWMGVESHLIERKQINGKQAA